MQQQARIRLIKLLILCWVTAVIAAYYEHITTVVRTLFPPVRAAATVVGAALGGGFAITTAIRWRAANWREAIPFQFCIGIALISYSSFALAAFDAYRPPNVRILIAAILVCSAAFAAYNASKWYQTDNGFSRLSLKQTVRQHSRGRMLWLSISAVAIGTALIGALAPEIEFDALEYHLFLPRMWLEAGHPVDVVWEIASLFPLTWELVFGCAMALGGGSIAAKLIHFSAFVATAILVYELSRRYVPSVSPWLSVAIVVTVPSLLWEATTAYVDVALALCFGLCVLGLIRYSETREWQWLALTVFAVGLSMATKHLGLLILAMAGAGLVITLWTRTFAFRRVLTTTSCLGFSVLLPLPWYVRAWNASGNPLYPEMYGIFGARPPERFDDETAKEMAVERLRITAGLKKDFHSFVTLPWNMTMNAEAYRGSLGPVFLFIVPGLLFLRKRFALVLMGSWALFGYLLWATVTGYQMRYLLMLTTALSVLAAAAVARVLALCRVTRSSFAQQSLRFVLAGLLILNLPVFTPLHEKLLENGWTHWIDCVGREVPFNVVLHGEPEDYYLSRRLRGYESIKFINTHLPLNARVLSFNMEGDNYYLKREVLPYHFIPLRAAVRQPIGHDTQAIQALRALGITHLVFSKRDLPELAGSAVIATSNFIKKWYVLEYEDQDFTIYRRL